MNIQIKELPEHKVAYIRRTGSYFEPQDHWGKLIGWTVKNGLYPPNQSFIGISLDNPDHVEPKNCRHDACVTIPDDFDIKTHDEVQDRTIDGGIYALYHFYDTPEKLNAAYRFVYGEWLPNSDYHADFNRENLEFNMNNPAEDPEGKCKIGLYVPIKLKNNE